METEIVTNLFTEDGQFRLLLGVLARVILVDLWVFPLHQVFTWLQNASPSSHHFRYCRLPSIPQPYLSSSHHNPLPFYPGYDFYFPFPRWSIHPTPSWVKNIIRKSIETPNLAHRNLESEPTNRDPAWDWPKPFIYTWQLCSWVYLQDSAMEAGSVPNALVGSCETLPYTGWPCPV